MQSMWGKNIVISLFGESHGPAIGCVIDGLPSGIELDLDKINTDLKRRAAKSYQLATPRKESDAFEILSGYFNQKTTGTPLCAIIQNTDTRSKDYTPELLRPGHADHTAYKRYSGHQDYRGGGHFSGRLTAPLVLAGSICKQILETICPSIRIGSRIFSLGSIRDRSIKDWREYNQIDLSGEKIPFLTPSLRNDAEEEIRDVIEEQDSLGGIIEGWIAGELPVMGNPFFHSLESELASLLFSIPAVKGVEFGTGFEIANMKGSEANDSYHVEDKKIVTDTNNNGGIIGGISNGMPIVFRCAFKPTPSIAREQKTVNINTMTNETIKIKGRHDPCIVLRAPVVVEAVSAICVLNEVLGTLHEKS